MTSTGSPYFQHWFSRGDLPPFEVSGYGLLRRLYRNFEATLTPSGNGGCLSPLYLQEGYRLRTAPHIMDALVLGTVNNITILRFRMRGTFRRS